MANHEKQYKVNDDLHVDDVGRDVNTDELVKRCQRVIRLLNDHQITECDMKFLSDLEDRLIDIEKHIKFVYY